jgi:hypothetical protein
VRENTHSTCLLVLNTTRLHCRQSESVCTCAHDEREHSRRVDLALPHWLHWLACFLRVCTRPSRQVSPKVSGRFWEGVQRSFSLETSKRLCPYGGRCLRVVALLKSTST